MRAREELICPALISANVEEEIEMHLIKLNALIAGVVVLLIAVAIFLHGGFSVGGMSGAASLSASSESHLDSSDTVKVKRDIVGDAGVAKVSNVSPNSLPERYKLTASEESEAKAWVAKMGGLSKGNTEYAQYSPETLKKLAQEGDSQAIDALGAYYLKELGVDAAKQFYFDAAVQGATQVFTHLAKIESYYKYGNAASVEEKNASVIEVVALYNVAKLRGNRWPNITGADSFINMNKIQLSEDDVQKIELRSQEIYDQLQQKRTELGLGAFDNSVPDSVKKYFDRFEYLNSEGKK